MSPSRIRTRAIPPGTRFAFACHLTSPSELGGSGHWLLLLSVGPAEAGQGRGQDSLGTSWPPPHKAPKKLAQVSMQSKDENLREGLERLISGYSMYCCDRRSQFCSQHSYQMDHSPCDSSSQHPCQMDHTPCDPQLPTSMSD